MDVYTDFPFVDLQGQSAFADKAQTCGYTGVWATENKHDPFLMVAAAARRNRSLLLGTGVIALLARNPFTVAQMAWDLHHNTGERFVLGIGTHQDVHLNGRFGLSAERKHERLVEHVAAVREIWNSWQEMREPRFHGSYYSITACPAGFRPTTPLASVPAIYLMCATYADWEIAPSFADGVLLHPTWTRKFVDRVVGPKLSQWQKSRTIPIPVIDGSVVSTGDSVDSRRRSRRQAQERIGGYWLRDAYDEVYETIGVLEPIRRFRNQMRTGQVDWQADWLKALYATFVCDAPVSDLPEALEHHTSRHITGIFPNIVSDLPRLLPSDVVKQIRHLGRTEEATEAMRDPAQ